MLNISTLVLLLIFMSGCGKKKSDFGQAIWSDNVQKIVLKKTNFSAVALSDKQVTFNIEVENLTPEIISFLSDMLTVAPLGKSGCINKDFDIYISIINSNKQDYFSDNQSCSDTSSDLKFVSSSDLNILFQLFMENEKLTKNIIKSNSDKIIITEITYSNGEEDGIMEVDYKINSFTQTAKDAMSLVKTVETGLTCLTNGIAYKVKIINTKLEEQEYLSSNLACNQNSDIKFVDHLEIKSLLKGLMNDLSQ